MFVNGDEVEFWNGYHYRHGTFKRQERGICYVLVKCAKIKRIYKVKSKQLNYWRGFENADGKKKFY